jgi:hypothetical protein
MNSRSSLLALLVALVFCGSVFADSTQVIQAARAAQHVGETVTVKGTVAEVHPFKGGSVVLDIGARYPNQVFQIYIPVSLASSMGDLSGYEGKTVTVQGTIELYRGIPEIELLDAAQLNP